MSNIGTVGEIYAAFGQGDVESILARLAEDVGWDRSPHGNAGQSAGLPYLQARDGRDEVAAFFADVSASLEFERFEVIELLEGDDRVVALIDVRVVNRATGEAFDDLEAHVWSFDDEGRVIGLEHVLDTAKHIGAAGS